VAKENNYGSINNAQKAGKTAKSALGPHREGSGKWKGKQAKVIAIKDDSDAGDGDAGEPALVPKPRGKPGPKPHGKPGPKPGTKRKRMETEIGTPSPRKLRKRA